MFTRSTLLKFAIALVTLASVSMTASAQFPRFKVLAFYSRHVEGDHVKFAEDAIKYFKELTVGNGFVFDTTSNMADMNYEKIKDYQVVMTLNNTAGGNAQQKADFQKYMENGGGWYGFHVAAYNDKNSNWPWFLEFIGGGVFYRNNWPAMPAKLIVEDHQHMITKALPDTYISPENEWYQWKPSPRERKNIKVFVSLSPDNYPMGIKDIVPDGDLPVVWTNTDYRMIYLNMGHGTRIFNDATQNLMFIQALKWVAQTEKKGETAGK